MEPRSLELSVKFTGKFVHSITYLHLAKETNHIVLLEYLPEPVPKSHKLTED